MTVHLSVMPQEIQETLIERFVDFQESGVFVDCTLGGGGHTSQVLQWIKRHNLSHRVIAFDRDGVAIQRACSRFEDDIRLERLKVVHAPFSEACEYVKNQRVYGVLADLGISSDQLDEGQRGMSFRFEGPLDMRMDQSKGISCFDYLHHIDQNELENVIRTLGEEKFAGRIARVIIEARDQKKLENNSLFLAKLIQNSVPKKFRYGRIHPATRTFQALRIRVNDELEELDSILKDMVTCLHEGGRMGVISFHSLEDRRVKQCFRELHQKKKFSLVQKKAWVPTDEEIASNSRARSAKYRVIEKVR